MKERKKRKKEITYIYTISQKYLSTLKMLFLILKESFLNKQAKHHDVFIYYTKYNTPPEIWP